MKHSDATEIFFALVERGEEYIHLSTAWMALTEAVKGPLNCEQVAELWKQCRKEISEQVGKKTAVLALLKAFNQAFVHSLHFKGNSKDYQDPANSYVDDVLDRRIGIPISLSLVY